MRVKQNKEEKKYVPNEIKSQGKKLNEREIMNYLIKHSKHVHQMQEKNG